MAVEFDQIFRIHEIVVERQIDIWRSVASRIKSLLRSPCARFGCTIPPRQHTAYEHAAWIRELGGVGDRHRNSAAGVTAFAIEPLSVELSLESAGHDLICDFTRCAVKAKGHRTATKPLTARLEFS